MAISAVAVTALGLAGLRAVDLPGPRPISDTDRLRIEVVHPAEPEITPGSVMDVGELVDGFQGLPPARPIVTDVRWSYDDGWTDSDASYARPRPEGRQIAESATSHPAPEADLSAPVRAVQRWFGFDEPRRDYQAERYARRARMEEMERHARERHARERYAAGRHRRDRAEDRYALERRRAELHDGPPWRDDRRPPPPSYRQERGDPGSGWHDGSRRGQAQERAAEQYYARSAPLEWSSVPPPGPRPSRGWVD